VHIKGSSPFVSTIKKQTPFGRLFFNGRRENSIDLRRVNRRKSFRRTPGAAFDAPFQRRRPSGVFFVLSEKSVKKRRRP